MSWLNEDLAATLVFSYVPVANALLVSGALS
jgi:hypothetical protein